MLTNKITIPLAAIAGIAALTSCQEVNDDRIPPCAVNIDLGSQGLWDTYGVHSLGTSQSFIKDVSPTRPVGFFYSVSSYTGFGGVILVTDIVNTPLAYDLSCPVERQRDIRVAYDPETLRVKCKVCGSVYDVSEFYGSAVSGPAKNHKYGLRRYNVLPALNGGYVIRN